MDRLSFTIKNFISRSLGPRFTEAPALDYKRVQNESNNKNPVIFVLSPGTDPTNMLNIIATNCNKKNKLLSLSLGTGLESNATK